MEKPGQLRNFICIWADQNPTKEDLRQILADHETWVKEEEAKPKEDQFKTIPPHYLRKAVLQDADLSGANLKKADLSGANLKKADLFDANLQKAVLSHANLQEAVLFNANLQEARLWDANLQEAHLFNANLQEADLWGADLRGADLRSANLSNANVTGVEYDRAMTCQGARVDSCYGNALFKREVEDLDWLEAFLESRKTKPQKRWAAMWWISSDYGRNPWKWVKWSLGIAVFFGLIFQFCNLLSANFTDPAWWLPVVDFSPGGRSFGWFTPYYYSIVTFTTLGFGDVTPRNTFAEIVVTLEVIIGYVMLGGLISILANKLARRAN